MRLPTLLRARLEPLARRRRHFQLWCKLAGAWAMPVDALRLNVDLEWGTANRTFTRIDPRRFGRRLLYRAGRCRIMLDKQGFDGHIRYFHSWRRILNITLQLD